MAEFTPITFNTQEEYDSAFKDRIERERKKFEGYISPEEVEKLNKDHQAKIDELSKSISSQDEKYKNFDAQLAERDAKIAKYESDSAKTRLAIKYKIPFELADKISGSTPEEMEKDAKNFAAIIGANAQQMNPGKSPEFTQHENMDGVTKRFKELNPNLKF